LQAFFHAQKGTKRAADGEPITSLLVTLLATGWKWEKTYADGGI